MIRVFRDGKWSDRLHSARYSLLQRESELEDDLYHGMFTLVYFLHDIRVDDIVECAYTVEGDLPYFSSYFSNQFSLQGPVLFEHLYRRLLVSSGSDIDCKLFHTSAMPRITHLSPELTEWSWELKETEPFVCEEDTPEWYCPIASVQLSQYKSWAK